MHSATFLASHRRLSFRPHHGENVREGLAFTRLALADWQLAAYPELTDAALLVAAELLANASAHAGGPVRLDLDLGARLRIAVTDTSPAAPHQRPHRPDQPYGHGLLIVDRLSAAWGHHQLAGEAGKTVWAELSTPRPRTSPDGELA